MLAIPSFSYPPALAVIKMISSFLKSNYRYVSIGKYDAMNVFNKRQYIFYSIRFVDQIFTYLHTIIEGGVLMALPL